MFQSKKSHFLHIYTLSFLVKKGHFCIYIFQSKKLIFGGAFFAQKQSFFRSFFDQKLISFFDQKLVIFGPKCQKPENPKLPKSVFFIELRFPANSLCKRDFWPKIGKKSKVNPFFSKKGVFLKIVCRDLRHRIVFFRISFKFTFF